jgi:putative peptidoglycan lipid II flippase
MAAPVTSESRGLQSLAAVGRSVLILTGGAAIVQVVGIVRELFLATNIGASVHLDALLVALALPVTLPGILTSGTATALVPAYLEARAEGGAVEARRLAGTVLVWVSIGGAVFWLLLAAFPGIALTISGPGLSEAGRTEAAGFLQLFAPIALITSMSPIVYAVCQAEERFGVMATAGVAGAATTLTTMLIFWGAAGLSALAMGLLIGAMVNLAILLGYTIRASVAPLPGIRPGTRLAPFIRHAAPLTLGAAILPLNAIADRAVASLLGPGAVSVLRYADVLVRVPIGAIGPAWGSALYPALVRSTMAGVANSLAVDAERAMRFATAIFTPVAMLTIAVAPLAVQVAYGRGAFSVAALAATSGAVAAFAPLLLILMIQPVLIGAHNARRHGRLLLGGAILSVGLNFVLDVVLAMLLGVVGVALSSSFTAGLVLTFFAWRLRISEAGFTLSPIARTIGLAVAASAPVTIIAAIYCWTGSAPAAVGQAIAALVGIGVVGIVGYVLAASWFGMEEPPAIIQFVMRGVHRRRGRGGV